LTDRRGLGWLLVLSEAGWCRGHTRIRNGCLPDFLTCWLGLDWTGLGKSLSRRMVRHSTLQHCCWLLLHSIANS